MQCAEASGIKRLFGISVSETKGPKYMVKRVAVERVCIDTLILVRIQLRLSIAWCIQLYEFAVLFSEVKTTAGRNYRLLLASQPSILYKRKYNEYETLNGVVSPCLPCG